MDTYEAVMMCIKVLIIIYLVVIPWTFGPWVWLPGFTGAFAIAGFLAMLCNKPSPHGSAQAIHAANEQWAHNLVLIFCYVVYYIAAFFLSLVLQNKWFDRMDRKEAQAKRSVRHNDVYQEWKVVPDQTPPARPKAITRKPLALPPGRPNKDSNRA